MFIHFSQKLVCRCSLVGLNTESLEPEECGRLATDPNAGADPGFRYHDVALQTAFLLMRATERAKGAEVAVVVARMREAAQASRESGRW